MENENHTPQETTSISFYNNQPANKEQATACLKILLGCCKTVQGVDPQIFAEGALLIMSRYPLDILKTVVDPHVGLPSKLKWDLKLADITETCEMLMGPRRQYEDKLKRRAEQLDARDEWNKPRTGPRKTAAEILKSFEEVGFEFGSSKKRITVSPEEFQQRYGISQQDFDELPSL